MFKEIIRKIAIKSGIPRFVWQASIHNEIAFWDRFLATKGLEWKDSFHLLLDSERPIEQKVTELLPEGDCTILDVGAGVLTMLGKTAPNRRVQITAVDPLARQYDKLLAKYDITPLVRTQYGKAEELTAIFGRNSFDLVHARNCIDHSFNPLLAFRQMIEVVKPGNYVIASHAPNEGINENYVGLHQWNFFSENGEFMIGDRHGRNTNVSMELKEYAETECVEDKDWLVVKFRKLI